MDKFMGPAAKYVVVKSLPDFVAKVFYRNLDAQAWRNEVGTAFGDSKPNNDKEIKKALTWLVGCFGGYITWSNKDA